MNLNPDVLGGVQKFHELFNHPVALEPQMLTKERALQRLKWMRDELDEYEKAVMDGDVKEQLDALADLDYFKAGTLVEMGCTQIYKEVFDMVQESNMSKACISIEEATETQENYLAKGISTYVEQKDLYEGSLFLVFQSSDGKILKSINYKPVDLTGLVERNFKSSLEI